MIRLEDLQVNAAVRGILPDFKMHLHYSHPDPFSVMDLVAPKTVQKRVKAAESLA